MGLNSEDPIRFIKLLLESKSSAKQVAYKNICKAFSTLEAEGKSIVEELKRRANPADKDVTVEFNQINPREFDVKLAGDMLIFVQGTNIVTLEELKDTAEKLKREAESKERWREVEANLKKAADELSSAFRAAFRKRTP